MASSPQSPPRAPHAPQRKVQVLEWLPRTPGLSHHPSAHLHSPFPAVLQPCRPSQLLQPALGLRTGSSLGLGCPSSDIYKASSLTSLSLCSNGLLKHDLPRSPCLKLQPLSSLLFWALLIACSTSQSLQNLWICFVYSASPAGRLAPGGMVFGLTVSAASSVPGYMVDVPCLLNNVQMMREVEPVFPPTGGSWGGARGWWDFAVPSQRQMPPKPGRGCSSPRCLASDCPRPGGLPGNLSINKAPEISGFERRHCDKASFKQFL